MMRNVIRAPPPVGDLRARQRRHPAWRPAHASRHALLRLALGYWRCLHSQKRVDSIHAVALRCLPLLGRLPLHAVAPRGHALLDQSPIGGITRGFNHERYTRMFRMSLRASRLASVIHVGDPDNFRDIILSSGQCRNQTNETGKPKS